MKFRIHLFQVALASVPLAKGRVLQVSPADSYESVGTGSCVDYLKNEYNYVDQGSKSTADDCATSCSALATSFQVGFDFLANNICRCLYSQGNGPSGVSTDKSGIYSVISSSGTDGSCYRTKVANPPSVNSYADYSSRSIVVGDGTSPCAITLSESTESVTCSLSYTQLSGSVLAVKFFSGLCSESPGELSSPVDLAASDVTLATSQDTLSFEETLSFTVSERNSGETFTRQYCARADVYDLMSRTSILARKLQITASIGFDKTGTFQTADFSVVEATVEETATDSKREIEMRAVQGQCSNKDAEQPPLTLGSVLELCLFLVDADDVKMTEIMSLQFFAGGQEITSPIKNSQLDSWTEFVDPPGSPSVDAPLKEVGVRTLILSSLFDAAGSGGTVILIGTAKLVYGAARDRKLLSDNESTRALQTNPEEASFYLELKLASRDEGLPAVVTESSGATRSAVLFGRFL